MRQARGGKGKAALCVGQEGLLELVVDLNANLGAAVVLCAIKQDLTTHDHHAVSLLYIGAKDQWLVKSCKLIRCEFDKVGQWLVSLRLDLQTVEARAQVTLFERTVRIRLEGERRSNTSEGQGGDVVPGESFNRAGELSG